MRFNPLALVQRKTGKKRVVCLNWSWESVSPFITTIQIDDSHYQ